MLPSAHSSNSWRRMQWAFYASGRASLEASFMYQLFARADPSMVRRLILTATV